MEIKKSPKANLEDKRLTFVFMGLIVALAILYTAFEWTQREITVHEVVNEEFLIEEIKKENNPQMIYLPHFVNTDIFKNLNTELLGLSVDSNLSHLAWIYDIYLRTGIQVPFPIISIRNASFCKFAKIICESNPINKPPNNATKSENISLSLFPLAYLLLMLQLLLNYHYTHPKI